MKHETHNATVAVSRAIIDKTTASNPLLPSLSSMYDFDYDQGNAI